MPKVPRVKSIRVRRRRPTCLGCSLRGFQCHYGTLAGNCTECGRHKASTTLDKPSTHFSEVPETLSELFRQAQATLPLQPDGSPDSLLRIQAITVVDGTKRTHTLAIPGGSYYFEKQIKDEMDTLTRQFCFSSKTWIEFRTPFCQAAMYARGYLALLLSPLVNERRTPTSDGEDEDGTIHGGCLALQLVPIILSRLDDITGLIMSGFGWEQTNDDQEYWTDVSIAAAIFHQGLDGVHSQLASQKARPFYDNAEFTTQFRERVKSTADKLITALLDRGLGCSLSLASRVNLILEDMPRSILVESITLTQERHPINIEALYASPQTSSATELSPYQSPLLDQVSSASITEGYNDFFTSGAQTVYATPNAYAIPSPPMYLDSTHASYPAPLAIQYQVPEPPHSANNQLHHPTAVKPIYSQLHGHTSLQARPHMNTIVQNHLQGASYMPISYKPAGHSYGSIWPLPPKKPASSFGDSWPGSTVIPVVDPGPMADYFGYDSPGDLFPQLNHQEDEYYSPPMPSYVSSADMFYPPLETSIPMASYFSAPFWPEQQHVTWRQS